MWVRAMYVLRTKSSVLPAIKSIRTTDTHAQPPQIIPFPPRSPARSGTDSQSWCCGCCQHASTQPAQHPLGALLNCRSFLAQQSARTPLQHSQNAQQPSMQPQVGPQLQGQNQIGARGSAASSSLCCG